MWKKDEGPAQPSAPRAENHSTPERPQRSRATGETATIGRSISIRGDVSGDEDLLIQGRVDGSVDLKEHAVTVGPDGEVKASIVARVVTIEGRVEGDLTAEEQVVLRGTAWVQGDIIAPRVVLEDGSRFRGGVDMGDMVAQGSKAGSAASSRSAGSQPSTSREPKQTDPGSKPKDSSGGATASDPSTGKGGKGKNPSGTTVEAGT